MTAPELTEPSTADDTLLDLKRVIKRCSECNQVFGEGASFCPFDGSQLAAESWDPGADSLLGAIVDDRYEVCAVLGEGGMGTVYKVRHTKLDRMFAMKVLRRDLARDKDLAERFTQEARATASIKHPFIVQITDYGKLGDDIPYFVMELLVGQPLSAALEAQGPLPLDVSVGLILKIAAALGAAHEAGVVHRDLKPDNVFLIGKDLADDIRIVDFGAAKIMGSSRITKTGIVFGTPHFMSPEQASGKVVDHRADIYALGIIMYELFTGRVPFEADTYMGVLTQHMFVKPIPPSSVSGHAGSLGALEDVTLKALEKEPEARFRSMEELAAEIRRVVRIGPGGEALVDPPRARVLSPPPSFAPTDPASDPGHVPREGVPLWVFAASGALILGAGGTAAWIAWRSPPPEPPPSPAVVVSAPPPPLLTVPPPPPSMSLAASAPAASTADPPPRRVKPPPARRPPQSARPGGMDSDFVDPWKK